MVLWHTPRVDPDPSLELTPIQEAYNRLLEQHYNPPENSVAYLADLHSLVARHRDNPVMIDGNECYPMVIEMLGLPCVGRVERGGGFAANGGSESPRMPTGRTFSKIRNVRLAR